MSRTARPEGLPTNSGMAAWSHGIMEPTNPACFPSVTSAIVHVVGTPAHGDFKNSDVIGTCTSAGQYLDFAADNVLVTGRAATAPVLGVEAAP